MLRSSLATGLLAASIALAAAGCLRTELQQDRWAYTCPDGYVFTVEYTRKKYNKRNSAKFDDGEESFKLKQEESASGSRYVKDDYVLSSKGVQAIIMVEDEIQHSNCQGEKL